MENLRLFILTTAGLSFAITAGLMPFAIKWLRYLKYGQSILEDGPTWHVAKQGTPTMGGVVFIFAITIAILAALPYMMAEGDYSPIVMLGLSIIFGAIGVIDDWTKIRKKQNKGITAKQKFLLQIAASILFLSVMRYMDYLSNALYIPFIGISFELPWIVYLLIATFIIVGADNAVNITDGIDGLCSSVTLVIAVFFSFMFMERGNMGAVFALAIAGGLIGFFLFNKHPARIFMGDTGSLFLGGAVCAMAFRAGVPLILITIGIVYILETLSDIIQVAYFKVTGGKRFFKMAPIHHHFEMCGWSEWKIVFVASGLTAIMCIISWFA